MALAWQARATAHFFPEIHPNVIWRCYNRYCSHEKGPNHMPTSFPFVAAVHRPGLPDIHIGFGHRHEAELASFILTQHLVSTQHVPGTHISYGPTPPEVQQLPPVPTDAYLLAQAIEAEPPADGTGQNFPDLYSRLCAQEGGDRAIGIWRRAIDMFEQIGSDPDELPDATAPVIPHDVRDFLRELANVDMRDIPAMGRSAVTGFRDKAQRLLVNYPQS